MHGAAQTANAAPSSALEPLRRAPPTSSGATIRFGSGSRPMNASPTTISRKPAICLLRRLAEHRRDARRGGAEHDEDDGEAGDEREAADEDPARRPRLAQPAGLDRRDRRQVAGHERQHARRHDREEAREERDRDAREHAGLGLEAGELLVEPPFELGVERTAPVGHRVGRRLDGRTARARPAPDRDAERRAAPTRQPDERQHPGEQVEAALRRRGEHALAELVDELPP